MSGAYHCHSCLWSAYDAEHDGGADATQTLADQHQSDHRNADTYRCEANHAVAQPKVVIVRGPVEPPALPLFIPPPAPAHGISMLVNQAERERIDAIREHSIALAVQRGHLRRN